MSAQSAQTPPPVFRAETDLVVIEARVTGSDRRAIGDLTADDFTVRVDGVPRRVVSAEYVDFTAGSRTGTTSAVRSYSTNTSGDVARTLLFAVDTDGLPPAGGTVLARAIDRFLARLSDDDLVGLVALPTGIPHVAPTRDRTVLRERLRSLVSGRQDFYGRYRITPGEALEIERRQKDVAGYVVGRECMLDRSPTCPESVTRQALLQARMARDSARNRLRALAGVVEGLPPSRDPMHVVVVSAGLIHENEFQRLYSDTARKAAVHGATLSVIQLDAVDASAEDALSGSGPDGRIRRQGLSNLAGAAGGDMILAVTPDAGLEDLGRELASYYLLALETKPGDRDGAPHRLDVQTRRPGATVRHRRHFIAVDQPKRTSERERIEELLRAPGVDRGIPLAVQTSTVRGDDRSRLQVSLVARIGPPAAGKGMLGLEVRDGSSIVTRRIDRLADAKAGADGAFTHVSALLVPPGRYRLRLAVVDEQGRDGSVDHVLVADLPPAGPLRTSDLLLGYLEGRAIRPALDVSRSDTIAAMVELYSTEAATPAPEVSMTMYRGGEGGSVMTRPAEIRESGVAGVAQAIATFAAEEMPAGEYIVRAEIRAGDARARVERHVLVHASDSAATTSTGSRGGEADAIVRKAGAYVEAYLARLSNVVMEEAYTQQKRQAGTLEGRTMRSDVLLVALPGGVVTGFRDVFEVDGRAVRDRDERLRRLFIEQRRESAVEQARQIAAESSRYNLGSAVRTLNLPTIPLQFLLPAEQSRIRYEVKDERTLQARRLVRITFEEIGSPTIIKTPGGDEIRAGGEFWVDPQSGEVLRADTNFEVRDARVYLSSGPMLVGNVSVTFAPNDALKALVPDRMIERYELRSGELNECTATYSNFRQFIVRTEERVPPPPR